MNKPLLGKSQLLAWLLFAAFSAQSEQNLTQSLTMDEAIKLATQSQPLLQSLDDAAAASREAAVAEGQLPDPKLKFGVQNLPITSSVSRKAQIDEELAQTSASVVGSPAKTRSFIQC